MDQDYQIVSNDGWTGGWISGYAVCTGCNHRWVSIRPDNVTTLECPKCGELKGLSYEDYKSGHVPKPSIQIKVQ